MSTSGNRRRRRSAKKAKLSSDTLTSARQRKIAFGVFGVLVAAMVLAVTLTNRPADPNRVWSSEHGHWHDANGQEIK